MALPSSVNHLANPPYGPQSESKLTSQAIKDLAAQLSRPQEEVCELLNVHLFRLSENARIKQFVMLLAIKAVKQYFTVNQSPQGKAYITVDSIS